MTENVITSRAKHSPLSAPLEQSSIDHMDNYGPAQPVPMDDHSRARSELQDASNLTAEPYMFENLPHTGVEKIQENRPKSIMTSWDTKNFTRVDTPRSEYDSWKNVAEENKRLRQEQVEQQHKNVRLEQEIAIMRAQYNEMMKKMYENDFPGKYDRSSMARIPESVKYEDSEFSENFENDRKSA
jgi:hypothetical protein